MVAVASVADLRIATEVAPAITDVIALRAAMTVLIAALTAAVPAPAATATATRAAMVAIAAPAMRVATAEATGATGAGSAVVAVLTRMAAVNRRATRQFHCCSTCRAMPWSSR